MSVGFEPKWRGIKTTQKPKHEDEPKTVINRFDQLTISLPRVDDGKRWAGYPGITGISRKAAKIIPKCKIFVEVFAGTAKVFQEFEKRKSFTPDKIILNDTSDFINMWLKKNMYQFGATVTKLDFVDCIKQYDSKDTFFMIDQPWFKGSYEQTFSSFNRDSVKEYDHQIISLCTGKPFGEFNPEHYKIKGKFIITTRKENEIMLKSGLTNRLVKSEYVVCGKYPKVLITTNLDLKGVRL